VPTFEGELLDNINPLEIYLQHAACITEYLTDCWKEDRAYSLQATPSRRRPAPRFSQPWIPYSPGHTVSEEDDHRVIRRLDFRVSHIPPLPPAPVRQPACQPAHQLHHQLHQPVGQAPTAITLGNYYNLPLQPTVQTPLRPTPYTPSRSAPPIRKTRQIVVKCQCLEYNPGDIRPPSARITGSSDVEQLVHDWDEGNNKVMYQGVQIPMSLWPVVFLGCQEDAWRSSQKAFSEQKVR
jgi:hypothetical protein